MAKKPSFWYEARARARGYDLVIGVDEVGRGALAGPVVAGAVVLPARQNFLPSAARVEYFLKPGSWRAQPALPRAAKFRPRRQLGGVNNWEDLGIDDSKRLTAKKRQELNKLIRKYALWGIGEVGVSYINRHGIVKATQKAMRSAVKQVARSVWRVAGPPRATSYQPRAFVLLDAFHVKYIPGVGLKNQVAIIKGDQKVFSIAAASIVAKVYRDRLMTSLSRKNRRYRWAANKGYGTKQHQKAIKKFGLSKFHRLAFVKDII